MYHPTANSYFSGAGLIDLGLEKAGIRVKQSLEIDPIAAQTLRANFDHKVLEVDIREKTCLDQFRADIHTLTFPCQFYSTASTINGKETTRVRGDELFLHAFRHVVLLQPEAFIVENVPRMKAHRVVMECFTKLPGYYIQTFCPVNASNWVPQDRKRLILIATKRKFHIDPPKGLNPLSLADIFEPAPDLEVPNYVTYRMGGRYRDKPIVCDPTGKKGRTIAPTLLANYGSAKGSRVMIDPSHPLGYRQFTVKEYRRLMGVPDEYIICGSERDQYRQVGNGVVSYLAEWAGSALFRYFNTSTRN